MYSIAVPKLRALLFVGSCLACPHVLAQQLEWRVVNRFPVFENADDFLAIEKVWSASGTAAATVDAEEFTRKLRSTFALRRTAWRPASGTYDRKVLFRSHHELKARVTGLPPGALCAWSLNEIALESTDCAESPTLRVLAKQPFALTATPAGAEPIRIVSNGLKERLIVALGDSFASGEGNPDHPATFVTGPSSVHWYINRKAARHIQEGAAWWDEACHRSLLSWPALAALSIAVTSPHEVVQFASFACSGAEVYDGVLRAQIDPPGDHVDYLVRGGLMGISKRDGGAGYKEEQYGEAGQFRLVPPQDHRVGWLRLSQQHALALLLCDEGTVTGTSKLTTPEVQAGVTARATSRQTYFGEVELFGCAGQRRRSVDNLLIAIGGNDVGFSGIVRWLITPPNGKNALNTFLLREARKEFGVLEPKQAQVGIQALPQIYAVLAEVINGFGIEAHRVILLQYPDPSSPSDDVKLCNARTREGNAPMQGLVYRELQNPNFLFGINPKEYRRLSNEFVVPLRSAQVNAAANAGWALVDAQNAFAPVDSEFRGYCGVASACIKGQCSGGDKVRWWTKPTYSNSPRMANLTEFNAYDGSRVRGLRYGTDALLTSVAPASNGAIRGDWISSSAHPTANIHARVADLVVQAVRRSP